MGPTEIIEAEEGKKKIMTKMKRITKRQILLLENQKALKSKKRERPIRLKKT